MWRRLQICATYPPARGQSPFGDSPPPELLAVVEPHVLRQEMTVECALTGDWEQALAILATDPLVQDLGRTRQMLRELLEANRQYLPQFFPR
jgi:6-phospho-beta-glucosidase